MYYHTLLTLLAILSVAGTLLGAILGAYFANRHSTKLALLTDKKETKRLLIEIQSKFEGICTRVFHKRYIMQQQLFLWHYNRRKMELIHGGIVHSERSIRDNEYVEGLYSVLVNYVNDYQNEVAMQNEYISKFRSNSTPEIASELSDGWNKFCGIAQKQYDYGNLTLGQLSQISIDEENGHNYKDVYWGDFKKVLLELSFIMEKGIRSLE